MPNDYAESILRSLRRIIRAIDIYSRELSTRFKLTVPQLVCLRQLVLNGTCATGDLARRVYLSQATVTGIVDRLELRGLVLRERGQADRRMVTVSLTARGRRLAESMPWPLQERFAQRLLALPETDQADIDRMLDRIVHMMEAQDIDAWPIVGAGDWSDLSDAPSVPGHLTEKEP